MPIPALALGLGGMSLLGGLFGGKKGGGLDAKTLERLFGPGAISADTMKIYQMLSQSPQFRQMLLQNSIQGSQFQNQLSGNLAQRGLSTSGIGSIANAAGESATQTGETALRGGLFGQSMDTAMQSLMSRLGAYSQGQQVGMQQPTGFQQMFGNALGAFGAAAPYFAQKKA